ncbi:MAG: tetrathionate reductase family octaheme c-type cytochrome [Proteobacteria bacterium]|nr:tetrathionate reductase family octaheme c-type cytochrome [Pseudomonadota bacterium]MBU1709792.1 tetrathionate reductase family octaheme c-type cytochrome [Pseudomonadota bacterium]
MLTFFASITLSTTLVVAADSEHTSFITGPISSGPEATKQCLECHEKQADSVMMSTHWTWSMKQEINGKTVERGKKNAINNFCTSVAGNWPRCTSCHIGYGWKDASFDFKDKTAVDCLVCHDTTGTYVKESTGAGMPGSKVDLLHVAQNVGKPVRDNCGVCHFFGGGGDAVKHGDLDSSMSYPDKATDVHMDAEGNDFSCQKCHTTESHKIAGHAMSVTPGGKDHVGCENCHDQAPHAESRLNAHAGKVACQTCHIPFYAKNIPTKLSWDWSTAGQDLESSLDQYGKHSYMKKKGSFTWGKMVEPEYAWYNGHAGAYMPGDKMDPEKITSLTYPLGDRNDSNAKIYPFKVHRGKQIYDSKNNIFITAKVFGDGGYWKDFDWDKAARLGMQASGLGYSGEYAFASTEMFWRINHMVSPKEQALNCLDCHGDSGRMPWKKLGYDGDPMNSKTSGQTPAN